MTRTSLAMSCLLASIALVARPAVAQDGIKVTLKSPLLICHEQTGGVRPPAPEASKSEPEHDLIFFVLSGKNADGSEILKVSPKLGEHLKIDNRRQFKFIKNIPLWKGTIPEGQSVTFALSVREQDGNDSAEEDLKEAAGIAQKIDNTTSLSELAKIPVREILQGGKGENDHLGTIIVRLKNVNGNVKLETELGADTRYLKGHASNHPPQRAFKLNGDHSDYDLHIEVEKD